jgi:hypothetical protein
MSETFHELMNRQFEVAGKLADAAMRKDDQDWTSAFEKWEGNQTALSEAIKRDFYQA